MAGGDDFVRCGTETNGITISRAGHIVMIDINDPEDGNFQECLSKAVDMGLIQPGAYVLVDLTHSKSKVDWSAVRALSQMRRWGGGRVAYVSREFMMSMHIKVMSAIFTGTKHRLFDNREAAQDWLNERTA
jgi:hypothetical protein